jgi:hypothetical protein
MGARHFLDPVGDPCARSDVIQDETMWAIKKKKTRWAFAADLNARNGEMAI